MADKMCPQTQEHCKYSVVHTGTTKAQVFLGHGLIFVKLPFIKPSLNERFVSNLRVRHESYFGQM